MTPTPAAKRYAALHKEMEQQRAERKWLGLPLRPGHLVQNAPGGPICEVVDVTCANQFLNDEANRRARDARNTDEE